MTRKNWINTVIASCLPLTAFGARKQDKVCYPVKNIWDTPQGQYVKMLRKELERLDHWDNLEEDWQLVEDSLKNGHLFFDVVVSRKEWKTDKLLYNIRPIFYEKRSYGDYAYIDKKLL